MTALEQFIRLEAEGTWREAPDSPPRDVLVSFGKATLVITTFQEQPLAHWALAATRRVATDGDEITFSTDLESGETLSLTEPLMIEAIEAVTAEARARRPRKRRRLGVPILAGIILAFIALAVLYGPQTLRGWAFDLIPAEQSQLISERILDGIAPDICAGQDGTTALAQLTRTVLGPDATPPLMLPMEGVTMARLPNGQVLLAARLLQEIDSQSGLAGWIALGDALPADRSALHALIERKSTQQVARFLSSGEITDDDLRWMEAATTSRMPRIETADLEAVAARLDAARISSTSFLKDVRARIPDLVADPPPRDRPDAPLLDDQSWVALQGLCEN